MLFFWKIRFFDRDSRQFGDRTLFLDTHTLDHETKATLEYLVESATRESEKRLVKYRSLFIEGDWHNALETIEHGGVPKFVGLPDYLEDQDGVEITHQELGFLLTGDPNSLFIPSGAKQHDIDLILSEPKPIPLNDISLSGDDARILGYFVRDLKEIENSALMKDGPGSISAVGTIPSSKAVNPTLETAVTDEEIRSFVTIFRRLYMENEPANFNKAVDVYVNTIADHPYAAWVNGIREEYNSSLESPPDFPPFEESGQIAFTTKRLIDAFLYTQYAHQPDKRRQRQFAKCLEQVGGKTSLLTWLFLVELWKSSLNFVNAGRVISTWFRRYCETHNVSSEILASIGSVHPGIGGKEKKESREKRLFEAKAIDLAKSLWKESGCPEGGHELFHETARKKLAELLNDNSS